MLCRSTYRRTMATGVAVVQGAELWRHQFGTVVLSQRDSTGARCGVIQQRQGVFGASRGLAALAVRHLEQLLHGVSPTKKPV